MKMKNGFTLIELMIVMAIIGILAAVVIPILGGGSGSSNGSFGVNGYIESRCINGYSVVVGADGQARQMMDTYGHGVQCNG